MECHHEDKYEFAGCIFKSGTEKKLEQQTALYEKNFYDSKNIKVIERKIEKQVYKDRMEYKVSYTLEGEIGVDWEIYVD